MGVKKRERESQEKERCGGCRMGVMGQEGLRSGRPAACWGRHTEVGRPDQVCRLYAQWALERRDGGGRG